MSTEPVRIVDELQRVFRGPSWHGPAVMELLAGVDHATAAAHPLQNAHSIWEIVLHIAAWKMIARRKLEGEVFDVAPEQDWPPIPQFTEDKWQEALAALESAHNALLDSVRTADPSRFGELVACEDYSVRFMLEGAAQHDAYHGGQIAVLKKAK